MMQFTKADGRAECGCYFCEGVTLPDFNPENYNITQCNRCGDEILTSAINDPANESMILCYGCDYQLSGWLI